VAAVLSVGCGSAPALQPTAGYPLVEQQRFRLFAGERLIGFLRDLEIQHPDGRVRFYRVETPTGAWVGNVDAAGRFYKSVPFQDELRPLGMFAWDPGLQLLFETDQRIQILPLQGRGEPAEASARDALRQARSAHLKTR
jgi:hypothetical protein